MIRNRFDKSRLDRVSALLDRYVSEGRFAGAQVQVAQAGEVMLRHTAGMADMDTQRAMPDHAIYRIYSMTKPITSVALMQLYEQGLVLLEDPVSEFIPSFADPQVLTGGTSADPQTRPAATVMTVKDVLCHTSGLTYGFLFESTVDEMYREANLGGLEMPDYTLSEAMELLGTMPLRFDPGTAWNYSVSTDVCGHLVEVISGQRLDTYIAEHITGPLGMGDTGFSVPEGAADRFTSAYASGADSLLTLVDSFETSPFLRPPTYLCGGGGMVSTLDDYQRFTDMLLNGGQLEGERVLGRKTLDYMTINHLPQGRNLNELGQSTFSEAVMEGVGFGLGFSSVVDPAASSAVSSYGEFAWGGVASTAFWVDPIEEVTCVFMTQFIPSTQYPIRRELRATVNQALI